MILYIHTNGQADFRKPARLSVGVFHYRTPEGRIVFNPLMRDLPTVFEYQQLQIAQVQKCFS